jgi:hypothetical protein
MSTPPRTTDDDLLELVRSADPLDGDVEPITGDAAEALLRQILAAPRPKRRRRLRLRTATAVRLAAVGAAVAVAAAAAVALNGGGRGGVGSASAAVLRHARAALAQPSNTILHVDMRATQTNGDGSTVSWRDESWQENAAPYDRRQIETSADGTTVESGNADGQEQIYDPARNTVYTSTVSAGTSSSRRSKAAHRGRWIVPGPTPGTFVVHLTLYLIGRHDGKIVPEARHESLVISARQARALEDGSAIVQWRRAAGRHTRVRPVVVAAPKAEKAAPQPDPGSQGFRGQILTLLRSGGAHVVGHATIGGRDTVEIRSRDGHTTYYVDPSSYAPVELDTTGTDGGVSLRFVTYEVLPANEANDALLSVSAQHPSATVDRDQADYVAAEQRLFPHG